MNTLTRTVAPEPQSPTHTTYAPASPEWQAPPRAPEWVRVVLTIVAMMVSATSIILMKYVPGLAELAKSKDMATQIFLVVIVYTPALLCYLLLSVLLTRFLDRRPVAALGLRINARSMAILACATALSVTVMVLVSAVMNQIGNNQAETSNNLGTSVAMFIITNLALAFILQGIGEEVLWRGYLMQSLSIHPKRALWVSATVFAAMHLISNGGQNNALDHVLYVVGTFGIALLAGYMALWTRSVWAAVGIHGGWHTGHMITRLLGLGNASIITMVVVGLVMIALALVIARRITPQRWEEIAQRGPFALPDGR